MDNEIVKKEPQALTAKEESPFAMMVNLLANGAEIDTATMKEMFAIRKDYEAEEARKAFHVSMAAFKENPPKIIKDKHNKQYDSKYSSLANVTATISKALSEHGLSATWKPDQKESMVYVTCFLTHRLGHSEKTTLFAPPDDSGKKNPIQQIKSTISYLEQITLLAAVGLATDDMGDDGNGAYDTPPPPKALVASPAEQEVISAICNALPPKEGFAVHKCCVKAILLEKCRDNLQMEHVTGAAEWLTGAYADDKLYRLDAQPE